MYYVGRCLPAVFRCGAVITQAYLVEGCTSADASIRLGKLAAFSSQAFVVGPVIGMYILFIEVFDSILHAAITNLFSN